MLGRASEVASELSVSRCGPAHYCSIVAPTAGKICLQLRKKTFATLSPQKRTSSRTDRNDRFAPEAAVHPESLSVRSDNKKQKATRALRRMAFVRLSPLGPPEIPSRGA